MQKGVCSQLFFNNQTKKSMLVFRLCEGYSMCCEVYFSGVFCCFLVFLSFSSPLTLASLCPAPALSCYTSGDKVVLPRSFLKHLGKVKCNSYGKFFPFSFRQKMLAMWKFSFTLIHILFESYSSGLSSCIAKIYMTQPNLLMGSSWLPVGLSTDSC